MDSPASSAAAQTGSSRRGSPVALQHAGGGLSSRNCDRPEDARHFFTVVIRPVNENGPGRP